MNFISYAAGAVLLAGGAGHGDGHINWFVIGSLVANFVFLMLLLPKVLKSLTGRTPKEHLVAHREDLARQLREAKEKQDAAEKRLAEYAKKLENLEGEVDAIVANYEAQGEADRKRLEEDASKAIERLVRESDFTIRQESLKAQKDIRAAAVTSTLEMAEKMLTESINDGDKSRLVDDYIASVASGANAPN